MLAKLGNMSENTDPEHIQNNRTFDFFSQRVQSLSDVLGYIPNGYPYITRSYGVFVLLHHVEFKTKHQL